MRKLFLFSALTLGFLSLKAQTINNVPIKDIKVEYIKITAEPMPFSTKEDIALDFGQEGKFLKGGTRTIKDETGEEVKFNSAIDALNFMAKFGFELVSTHSLHRPQSSITQFFYIMKKKKE